MPLLSCAADMFKLYVNLGYFVVCCSMYYKALVFCLTHGSWQSRRQAQASCRKILAVLGGAAISLDILREFRQVLNTQEVGSHSEIEKRNYFLNNQKENQILKKNLLFFFKSNKITYMDGCLTILKTLLIYTLH